MSREGRLSSTRKAKQTLPALTWLNLIVAAAATQAAEDNNPVAPNAASSAPSPSPVATPIGQSQNQSNPESVVQGDLTQVTVTGIVSDDYHRPVSDNPKYPERLIDTPQTITVIPQSLIKDQNASTLQQALQNVPGITFTAGEGGTLPGDNFNIRGFNARDNIYVDGFRDTGVYNRDPFNLEQIEVVEGPASVYSGYGSTGGSVNLISKLPTTKPAFEADFGVGTNNYYRLTGDLNEPLFHVMTATAPFNLTGLPALSMRFGTNHDGLPIGVQIVSSWLAESTVLAVASRLEGVSPFRDRHPIL